MVTRSDRYDANLGESKTYTLTRDGHLDLQFEGWLIGSGSTRDNERNDTRWVEVDVYLTTGGSLVTQRTGVSQWQGESDCFSARVNDTPAGALTWLVAADGEFLGEASKEAWVTACKKVPALKKLATEHVE